MTIIDTDVLIDALRGRPEAVEPVHRLLRSGAGATTAVTRFELRSGARSGAAREAVDRLLAALPVLPLDEAAADAAAGARAALEAEGRGIGMADYLIAGICLARSASLLTRNHRHFGRVEGLMLEPLPEP